MQAGWVGKGKKPNALEEGLDHRSRPIGSLRDPGTFGPPPRRGDAAGVTAAKPVRAGLGAPVHLKNNPQEQEEEQEPEKHQPPPVPYRVDTTGLLGTTQALPKPPLRVDNTAAPAFTPNKPKVPPRLPPRQNSVASAVLPSPQSPPPRYEDATGPPRTQPGYLNQGALNRLGNAGISVPALGITSSAPPPENPWADEQGTSAYNNNPSPQEPTVAPTTGFNSLQSRFSKLTTSPAASPTTSPAPPTQGTTWAQKQAALKTASSFRNDPSSVSLADAKNAASTANNFRERHGDQVQSGWKSANAANQKYGITNRLGQMNTGASSSGAPDSLGQGNAGSSSLSLQNASSLVGGLAGKKPPPPLPPKRDGSNLRAPTFDGAPPPVPLGSKPR